MLKKHLLSLLVCWACLPSFASADSVKLVITDDQGSPAANALALLYPKGEVDTSAWEAPAPFMRQEGTLFRPFVLPVKTGTAVTFPNMDEFRHHVYSFSKPKRFELRLYGQDETKRVVFDKPGVVALGCNIHDNMLAYIYVTDASFYAVAGEDGTALIEGVPAGDYILRLWHPDEASTAEETVISLSEEGNVEVLREIKLRSVRRGQLPPEGEEYP